MPQCRIVPQALGITQVSLLAPCAGGYGGNPRFSAKSRKILQQYVSVGNRFMGLMAHAKLTTLCFDRF